MQNIPQKIQEGICTALAGLGFPQKEFTVEHPKEESHGDYASNIALLLSRELKRNPMEIAAEIAENIPTLAGIQKIETAAPGFLNFWIESQVLANELQSVLEYSTDYGRNTWGAGQKWLLEHTSPNPNKAMHIGHLRNNVTAMAIANIWQFSGVNVVLDLIDNNRGIAIAKLMWGFLRFAHREEKADATLEYWHEHQEEWRTPEEADMLPDRFVDMLYVKGEKDFSSNSGSEQTVRNMVVDWENGDKATRALWEHVLQFSYAGQERTMDRLGSRVDHVWHEHEHYQEAKDLVEEGLKKGVFTKLADGAVLTQLKEYDLDDTIIIKADGTSLYITQDLSLTRLKRDTFQADKIFWVVGSDQILAFKQFFAVCEQLGIGTIEDFTHIWYGRMSVKGQGKMSSRLGNVIYIDDLIDIAKEEARERMQGETFSNAEKDAIAEKVALGAIKYSILKVGRTLDMEFDMESSIALEGNSGPYLQYAYARAHSLLAKAGIFSPVFTMEDMQPAENHILRCLYQFPEVVLEAAVNATPHVICTFLFELAKRYNAFYSEVPILSTLSEAQKNWRLTVTRAVVQILENGFRLLNIEAPQKM